MTRRVFQVAVTASLAFLFLNLGTVFSGIVGAEQSSASDESVEQSKCRDLTTPEIKKLLSEIEGKATWVPQGEPEVITDGDRTTTKQRFRIILRDGSQIGLQTECTSACVGGGNSGCEPKTGGGCTTCTCAEGDCLCFGKTVE